EEVWEADVVVERDACPARTDSGGGELLHDHGAEPEVPQTAAAQGGRRADAQEACLAGLAEHRLVHDAGSLPVLDERDDLLVDKLTEPIAEQIVGVVEQPSPHVRLLSLLIEDGQPDRAAGGLDGLGLVLIRSVSRYLRRPVSATSGERRD